MGRLIASTGTAMRPRPMMPTAVAAGLCLVAMLLAGCSEARPAWGPGTPRNGAGQPVDPTLGTPLPGYTTINNG
ncbi:MAG: hypothetical protein ACLQJR_17685 [Stellaceae bacterium]